MSKIPSPGKLHEISAAAANARSTAAASQSQGMKRKTLADRAGEPSRPFPAPPGPRPVNGNVRATSLAGGLREASFSSSVSSSRPPSAFSARSTSNSSHSSSVGPGRRPNLAQTYRPQSVMGSSRIQRPAYTPGRSATSLETHQEDFSGPGIASKRNGRTSSSSRFQIPSLKNRPLRVRDRDSGPSSTPALRTHRSCGMLQQRKPSLSTALNALTLEEHPPCPLRNTDCAVKTQLGSQLEEQTPLTPSHIPILAPMRGLTSDEAPLVKADSISPAKSPMKSSKKPAALPMYLNRDTNTVIAWDHDSRLADLEQTCSEFGEKMASATRESHKLEDMISVYKVRSKLRSNIDGNITLIISCKSRSWTPFAHNWLRATIHYRST